MHKKASEGRHKNRKFWKFERTVLRCCLCVFFKVQQFDKANRLCPRGSAFGSTSPNHVVLFAFSLWKRSHIYLCPFLPYWISQAIISLLWFWGRNPDSGLFARLSKPDVRCFADLSLVEIESMSAAFFCQPTYYSMNFVGGGGGGGEGGERRGVMRRLVKQLCPCGVA